MWKPYLVTNEAEGFAAALDGWPTAVGADALVAFVRELSAAVRADSASPSERGRARLLAAVAARREETKYRAVAPLPARAGTLLAATLAGGGLLAAAAANGADPIAFVRQAVQDVTQIAHLPPVFGEPQTAPAGTLAEVNIEGVITALTSAGAKFDLAYDAGEIRVELHDDTLLRRDDGSPVGRVALGIGSQVRVRGVRGGDGPVQAMVVELRRRPLAAPEAQASAVGEAGQADEAASRPAATAADKTEATAVPADATRTASAGPAVSVAVDPARSATPRPAATPAASGAEPLPLPLPAPAVTATATATPTRPSSTGTPTATATPTKAPTKTATPIATKPADTPTPTPKPTGTRTPAVDASPVATATAAPVDDKPPAVVAAADFSTIN